MRFLALRSGLTAYQVGEKIPFSPRATTTLRSCHGCSPAGGGLIEKSYIARDKLPATFRVVDNVVESRASQHFK